MSNRKSEPENQGRNLRGLAVLSLLFWTGLHGCNSNPEAICRDFPSVAEEIEGMQTQIATLDVRPEPKRNGKASRKLASVAGPAMPSAEEVGERRDAWMEWGERALKRTQWAKDALEDDKRGRKAVPALNEAGLSLVSFHGFLEQSKWRKANGELEKVESSLKRARKIACDVDPPARRPASVVPKKTTPKKSAPKKSSKKAGN